MRVPVSMAAVRVMSCRTSPLLPVLRSGLYCLCMLSMYAPRAGCLSFNISFSQPRSPANLLQLINYSGDARLTTNTLEFTQGMYSTGRATYMQPVPLWRAATSEMASFTTTFDFRIIVDPTTLHSDGLAFFLGHVGSGIPQSSVGGSLGLLPYATNGTGSTTMVAVEFDTFQDLGLYNDISGDHVGIDVNSLNSTASVDTTSPTKNLTSGYRMTATVTYHNVTKLLAVELNINGTFHYVNATVDLRSYLPEHAAVGFSASSGAASEQHQLLSWSFTSTLQEEDQHNKRSAGRLIIFVLVPLLSVLACAAAAALGLHLWQKHKRGSDDSDYEQQDDSRTELERGVAASGPQRYTYRELASATNNFAEDGKLGRGGFGSVYMGKLAVSGEERPVAIKMFSSESSAQGRKEFEAEVRIISRLKHRNLVQLLGWCDSRHGLLLVYELVTKGSLDKHIHSSDNDGDGERFLTWPQRYQIILGLGSALRYLHEEGPKPVVHGDIKPSNIMLDETMATKLGDFGLARLGDHGARWQTTKAVLGTAGYIDPEFVNTRHPSTHSDVYSFGIVLLEIVSSRCPVILVEGGTHFILLKWVWGLYGRNAILEAVDERLRSSSGDEVDDKFMERVLVVGLWCAHPDQSERPSIAQAMHVLQSKDARLPALTPQMYRSVSEFAVTGHAISTLSIQSSSSTGTATTGGHSKVSSESSSSALLRDSKELA